MRGLLALVLCLLATVAGETELNFVYADMLRGASNCRGCALGPVCPAEPVPPAPPAEPVTPLASPACAAGASPCLGGTALPRIGGAAVCLSGAQSPFGGVLDVLVSCGANGTSSEWSLCAGTDKTGCGNCACLCRRDAALTEYANNEIGEGRLLQQDGVCLGPSFLPGSVNPVALRLECRACA